MVKRRSVAAKINVSSTSRGTGAPVEVAPEPFIEPDAAQGFEEFENSQEVPITEEDVTFEELAKEQFVSELPEEERANVNPEELPVVVQRRVDAKVETLRPLARQELKTVYKKQNTTRSVKEKRFQAVAWCLQKKMALTSFLKVPCTRGRTK